MWAASAAASANSALSTLAVVCGGSTRRCHAAGSTLESSSAVPGAAALRAAHAECGWLPSLELRAQARRGAGRAQGSRAVAMRIAPACRASLDGPAWTRGERAARGTWHSRAFAEDPLAGLAGALAVALRACGCAWCGCMWRVVGAATDLSHCHERGGGGGGGGRGGGGGGGQRRRVLTEGTPPSCRRRLHCRRSAARPS